MHIERLINSLVGPEESVEEMAKQVIVNIQNIVADKDMPLAKKILIMRDKVASGELAEHTTAERIEELKRHDVVGKMCLEECRKALATLEAQKAEESKN